MGFTDIRLDLLSRLPLSWRPYALLMRLDRPIGWWLLLLPGWWAIALADGGLNDLSGWGLYMLILFFIGAVVMRGAGCVINDLWDRDLDAQVERTRARPLASGEVQVWQAVLFLFCLLFVGLIILVQTSGVTIWLGILALGFVVAYPYMKRITWWPQAFLGLTFNFGVPMGWGAVMGGLDWPVLLLYVGAIFWTLGYDTIYAHQDKEDDEVIGIKSTALLFGNRSKKWVGIFYGTSWALIALAALAAGAGTVCLTLLILPGFHMALQVATWDMESQQSSLATFKSNMISGLLFFFAFLAA